MKELAHSLYNSSYLTGEFVLRSGETSQQYFDRYQFEANPILLNQIALELVKLIPTETELLAALRWVAYRSSPCCPTTPAFPAFLFEKQQNNTAQRSLPKDQNSKENASLLFKVLFQVGVK